MTEEFDLEEELEGKKKRVRGDESLPNTGTLLLAALSIVLLAFFILLVSMASIDSKKHREALASIIGTFAPDAGRGAYGVLEGATGVREGRLLQSGSTLSDRRRFIEALRRFRELVKARGLEKEASIQGSFKGFTISLSESLLFSPAGAELLSRNYTLLDTVKFIISDGQKRFRVRVEGHTDDKEVHTPQYLSNWELSVARAIAVLRYVLRDSGIKGERLEAAGFAGFRPKFPNDSPENRARNRRVDIVFLVKNSPGSLDPKRAIEIDGFSFSF